jgi:hypothetical protein
MDDGKRRGMQIPVSILGARLSRMKGHHWHLIPAYSIATAEGTFCSNDATVEAISLFFANSANGLLSPNLSPTYRVSSSRLGG